MKSTRLLDKLVRTISDVSLAHFMHRRSIFVYSGCFFLAAELLCGQSRISADFGNRSDSTAVVPSGFLAVGGIGDPLADPAAIATLTSAGLNRTRFWIGLQQIYATSIPDFTVLDTELQIMSASGVHPIGVIYDTPPSLASSKCAPPSDVGRWGQMAASVVAHVDGKFPGVVQEYEIWNEPELPTSLCISDDTARLNTYVAMFAAAASAMHAQAEADGETIRTGGPVICHVGQAMVWIPALLNNKLTAPYVDFVSFHLYMTGQTEINNGMTWQDLYSLTQAPHGLASAYTYIEPFVRAGDQPNAAATPIYISEFNENWAFSVDCCRNDATYGPLWNSLVVIDLLNVVYSGATAVPSRIVYYNAAGKYFCLLGAWNADMDCDESDMQPYPQFYAFQLLAAPNYLNLQAGGHMAVSVSPGSTQSGLSATAFYTDEADEVVIVNPTASSYSSVAVSLVNPGLTSVSGQTHLLNSSNSQISSDPVIFNSLPGTYWATVAVPAYSTVALSMSGVPVRGAPTATLTVTPNLGTHPLAVSIDSSKSNGGGSAIAARTIGFGDGRWLNWKPSVTYTYNKAGNYTVLLTVRNQAGELSIASRVITVK
jgi:hypothetical protein